MRAFIARCIALVSCSIPIALRPAAVSAAPAQPLSYLRAAGARAALTLPLTWGLLAISIAVVVVVAVLLLVALTRRRTADTVAADAAWWVYAGVGLSSFVLTVALVWTVRVLASVNGPPSPAAFTIEVTAQQWWWKARYLDGDPSRVLTTANEIHIPVGQPVRVELLGADVIHSFWVPALAGKTDAIPGQRNVTWIEADQAGRYRGQCTEYCGAQHAHMGFEVVAESPEDFARWRELQLAAASDPSSDALARGRHEFEYRCGACHTVRGTAAGGTTGPDLTHVMSRRTIAAGTLPNSPATLAAWIANPQSQKPGTRMPNLQLSGEEIGAIDAWLVTLH
jgi:cytochrome c oxidase subunit 2